MRVLTVGETMALLDPLDDGSTYRLRIGGAESNFAVALSRLGVGVTWISRLGADPFGDLVAETLAGEGVDVRAARDPGRPTGVYFKSRVGGRTRMHYYRAGSAASALTSEDVPDEALEGVELLHLTGITTALGSGPRRLVHDLAERARARGIAVVARPELPARPVGASGRRGRGAAAGRLGAVRARRGQSGLRHRLTRSARGGDRRERRDPRGGAGRARVRRTALWSRSGRSASRTSSTKSARATASRPGSRMACCRAGRRHGARTRATSSRRARSGAAATGRLTRGWPTSHGLVLAESGVRPRPWPRGD